MAGHQPSHRPSDEPVDLLVDEDLSFEDYFGTLDREGIREIYAEAVLVTANYISDWGRFCDVVAQMATNELRRRNLPLPTDEEVAQITSVDD